MKTGRFFEIAATVILTVLAAVLACGITARLLLGGDRAATPATSPTPAQEAAPQATPPPSTTPTLSGAPPSPTETPVPFQPSPTAAPLVITDPSLTDRALLEEQLYAAPSEQRLVLRIGQDHLTREIAAYLSTQTDPVYRQVTVRFTPGLITLEGEVKVAGLWIPATVEAQATVSDCRPEATITGLAVGGLFTPRWARDFVADLLYDALDRYPEDLLICLESIAIGKEEAVIEATRR